MSDITDRIVSKLWSYCQVLRDDGLSYQDYLEQLTFLLFLKMADERAALTGVEQKIPKGRRWADLANSKMEGVKLEQHYRATLKRLGEQGGMLGLIFRKAQNKIQDPAKLRKLVVDLIGNEDWSSMSADVKGDAYEGLLERNAQDVKGGAGQYFTPRGLIAAIDALRGVELVDGVARLCAMNLFLKGIGPDDDTRKPPILGGENSLRNEPSTTVDVVLTNPPFGKKSSITVVNDEGETDRESITYNRPDFWTTTSNKQAPWSRSKACLGISSSG